MVGNAESGSQDMRSDLKIVDSGEQEEHAPEKEAPVEIAHRPGTQEHYLGGAYSSSIIKKIRKDPQAIGKLFKEGKYPYTDRIPRTSYEKEKAKLQIELLKVQNWVKMSGQKILVIFEGRDAAGKGGTIKRFMEHLNPRAAKIVALVSKCTQTNTPTGTSPHRECRRRIRK